VLFHIVTLQIIYYIIYINYSQYLSYLTAGLKIFIFVFIVGNFIDKIFHYFQEKYNITKSKMYGLIQLISIITIAYHIHINTSIIQVFCFQVYY
jgi:hypothetical protein